MPIRVVACIYVCSIAAGRRSCKGWLGLFGGCSLIVSGVQRHPIERNWKVKDSLRHGSLRLCVAGPQRRNASAVAPRWCYTALTVVCFVSSTSGQDYDKLPPRSLRRALDACGFVVEKPGLSLSDLFVGGMGGYHTFRIPALVVTANGSLLAICEGRKASRADHGDVDLVCRRSTDGGETWSPLRLIHEQGDTAKITIGNPCPVVDRLRGAIWLPFTRDNTDVLLTMSEDDGQTWKQPRNITTSVKRDNWTWYATGPGNGIQLTRGPHSGRLVIPCDHRVRRISDRRKSTRSHVLFSDDHGLTWKIGGVTEFLMNECAIVERSDGELLLNMRSNRGLHCRAVATSNDGGSSWSRCRDERVLTEPVCQASMVRYSWPIAQRRSRLLFLNPASVTSRQELTLRISYDEGHSWPVAHVLYAKAAAYSSLAVLPNREVGVLFERDDYSRISFATIGIEFVESTHANK
ncbi:MAG: glycosyl hydrolase [Planctomycetaceae bacterium]|nr:glycosyl hydrolase [Planctomycetaceae bacterium]